MKTLIKVVLLLLTIAMLLSGSPVKAQNDGGGSSSGDTPITVTSVAIRCFSSQCYLVFNFVGPDGLSHQALTYIVYVQ